MQKSISNVKDYEGQLEDAELRLAVDDAVQTYVGNHYPDGASTVHSKDGEIIVTLSGSKLNPGNFWNGRWRSEYTLKDGKLSGNIKVQCHYFEDGNVQLNSTKDVNVDVAGTDDKLASNLVKALEKAESEYQTLLNAECATMADTTFRALRRPLPLTRTKIGEVVPSRANPLDWAKITTYKIGEHLPGGTK
jgi:capping protein alpha